RRSDGARRGSLTAGQRGCEREAPREAKTAVRMGAKRKRLVSGNSQFINLIGVYANHTCEEETVNIEFVGVARWIRGLTHQLPAKIDPIPAKIDPKGSNRLDPAIGR